MSGELQDILIFLTLLHRVLQLRLFSLGTYVNGNWVLKKRHAHMKKCKHAATHSINLAAVHVPPSLNEFCVCSSFTQLALTLPISHQSIHHSIFKIQTAKEQKHTLFAAAPRLTLHSWCWQENGGPLRSEWLRLHYPLKAVVQATQRFIETHFFPTGLCVLG